MGNLTPRSLQDRSKINMHEPHEVQCWSKHLRVSQQQLQKAVDKVGHGAAAVRKELAARAAKTARPVGELPAVPNPRFRTTSAFRTSGRVGAWSD